jgi:DNA-binding CsgD family transcriptional regulator
MCPWYMPQSRAFRGFSLRAARIGGSAPANEQDVAVTIEPTSPAERLSLFVRAYGLSAREAELVTQLATGADTRQIAQRMFLSENMIQNHLKPIFAKTATRNRRTLLAASGRLTSTGYRSTAAAFAYARTSAHITTTDHNSSTHSEPAIYAALESMATRFLNTAVQSRDGRNRESFLTGSRGSAHRKLA